MKIVAVVLLFVMVAGMVGAQEITYSVPAQTANDLKFVTIGAFIGFAVGIILAAILSPHPSEWKIIDGEYVRVK